MLTRREKLLIRPWQLRKYNNHKKKVINAAPIIDFGPPPQRNHVTVKLKKLQKERERQAKIEEDNFKLLQQLGAIMRSKRVDNFWIKKPPNFLRRVNIYQRTRTPSPCLKASSPVPATNCIKRSRCLACDPQPEKSILIPQPRVPWDLPKKISSSHSKESLVCQTDSNINSTKVKSMTQTKKKEKYKPITANVKTSTFPTIENSKVIENPEETKQSIVLHQGQLRIIVNFPSLAEVKIVRSKLKNARI